MTDLEGLCFNLGWVRCNVELQSRIGLYFWFTLVFDLFRTSGPVINK